MNQIRIQDKVIDYQVIYTRRFGLGVYYHPDQEPSFTVRCSKRYSLRQIEEFLNKEASWILKQVNRPINKDFRLFGNVYEVISEQGNKNKIKVEEGKVIIILIDPDDQEVLDLLVTNLWKRSLKKYIESKKEEYARVTKKSNVTFSYRLMTSRYGSCKPSGNKITLNTQLATFPPELIDSVVYHEYAHFFVQNHSKAFYAILSTYTPNYAELNRSLKKFGFSNPSQCAKMNSK